ncbi:phenylalanine--tRNA ligase beta subunit [Pseudoclavibacter endophyticus]|uniref:Phenylalanine--tRNA ligase beta subunit n=1 Tax=Pseudoclavibacter endophyticus TaxID=1778590 RepID=A0A6H9WAS8_9MICO|nr:phenylalanine--tRNA ligase subunit beta [Pseudoclavibacter endophyticus]KAB1646947.1 phenylalanine--tRNA ligase subunit beta [Pseudoclavibacter endophyticus]GGA74175.1 phenylalanine--tRNA ligase beta subunit [Pseudoclavibacter endophyticus]
MRVPIGWLGEVVDLADDVAPQDVLDALVRVGLEDEDTHAFEISGPVVVGQVLERVAEPQSNGKTINWCQVRVAPAGEQAADGGADVRGVVCGAHNFEAGDKVVVTLPGAVLPGAFAIAARKTYGHVSDGMIASARELGLGDDHTGILVLSRLGLDPLVGTDAIELLGLDERSVEVNVTPDRGYAMSVRGIGREYSHATGATFHDPALRPELEDIAAGALAPDAASVRVPVTVTDARAVRNQDPCPVFVGTVVTGVDASRPTPPWMVARLALAGIRSLGVLVDITNYVMIELGQPIHGYDLDQLRGGITVRRAEAGEKLRTLDGKERTLSDEDLLITDDRGPIGLAGVMGGMETELGDSTRNVLIEAANFSPISIARTARRHKLPSEASRRFERGVDPRVAVAAAARVAELMVLLAGGKVEPQGSVHARALDPEPLTLRASQPEAVMGVHYTTDEIVTSLRAVGCEVWDEADGLFGVRPPSWRPDLENEVSLIEEVGRLGGFDRIPSVLPVAPPGRGLTRVQRLRRQTADVLAAWGAVETLSYPFTNEADRDRLGRATPGAVPAIKLANALDPQNAWLRTSMLPGLLQVAHRNWARGTTDLAVFEIGTVFLPDEGRAYGTETVPGTSTPPTPAELQAIADGLPRQPRWVGAVFAGNRAPKQPGLAATPYAWQDALEAVQRIGLATAAELRVRQGSHQAFHPGRCAEVFAVDAATGEERSVGYAGELHPDVTASFDLPRVVAALDLDLDVIIESGRREVETGAIVGFPVATQDLSLVLPADVPAGDVERTIAEGAGSLLEHIDLVDDYRGAGLDEGEKSLLFALRFRAPDRTLTAAEATESKEAGAALAAERYGARIRA